MFGMNWGLPEERLRRCWPNQVLLRQHSGLRLAAIDEKKIRRPRQKRLPDVGAMPIVAA